MDTQQAITLVAVAVCGVYLSRLGWRSWKAMWSGRAGCGSGCGKCVSAEIAERRRTPADGRRTTIIPLTAVGGPTSGKPKSKVPYPKSND